MKTGDVKHFEVPEGTDDDTYDMETDGKGPLHHESLAAWQGRRLRSGQRPVGDVSHADARLGAAARPRSTRAAARG